MDNITVFTARLNDEEGNVIKGVPRINDTILTALVLSDGFEGKSHYASLWELMHGAYESSTVRDFLSLAPAVSNTELVKTRDGGCIVRHRIANEYVFPQNRNLGIEYLLSERYVPAGKATLGELKDKYLPFVMALGRMDEYQALEFLEVLGGKNDRTVWTEPPYKAGEMCVAVGLEGNHAGFQIVQGKAGNYHSKVKAVFPKVKL